MRQHAVISRQFLQTLTPGVPLKMPTPTTAEFRRGAEATKLEIEAILQRALEQDRDHERPGLLRAMNIIAAYKVPMELI